MHLPFKQKKKKKKKKQKNCIHIHTHVKYIVDCAQNYNQLLKYAMHYHHRQTTFDRVINVNKMNGFIMLIWYPVVVTNAASAATVALPLTHCNNRLKLLKQILLVVICIWCGCASVFMIHMSVSCCMRPTIFLQFLVYLEFSSKTKTKAKETAHETRDTCTLCKHK